MKFEIYCCGRGCFRAGAPLCYRPVAEISWYTVVLLLVLRVEIHLQPYLKPSVSFLVFRNAGCSQLQLIFLGIRLAQRLNRGR